VIPEIAQLPECLRLQENFEQNQCYALFAIAVVVMGNLPLAWQQFTKFVQ
jgi:hypothetical protein